MTLLRDNLKRIFDEIQSQGHSLRQIVSDLEIDSSNMSAFLNGKRAFSPKVLEKISRSFYLQKHLGLDEESLFCLMTVWYLAENHAVDDLKRGMQVAFSLVKTA
jgi:plasmid maintenance system antidote protein VapI